MNKLKENKGVSLSAFVITILVILLIVAVVGCMYFYNTSIKSSEIVEDTQKLAGDIINKATTINEEVEEAKNVTYSDITGVYEYQFNGNIPEDNCYFKLELKKDGTFIYENAPGAGAVSGYTGTYIVEGNKIILNKLVATFSDADKMQASGTIELRLNDDKSITILNNDVMATTYKNIVLNKISSNIFNIKIENIDIENNQYYLKISGLDENNNEIWTYKTDKGNHATFDSVYVIAERNGIIYIKENENVVALNREDGMKKWSNKYEGCEICATCIDSKGNFYIVGSGSILYVTNKEGNIIKKINIGSIDSMEFGMNLNQNETAITITLMGDAKIVVNLN